MKTKPQQIKQAIAKVEMLKKEIAKKLDELRDAVDDVEDIVNSMDDSLDELNEGLACFERAGDSLSKFV